MTPDEYVIEKWEEEPKLFLKNPHYDRAGLNNYV